MIMKSTRTWASSAVLALCLPSSVFANNSKESPYDLVMRSMRRSFSVNVVAVISNRDSMDGSWGLVQVIRDKTGHIRKSILAPAKHRGIESVDDGERSLTYIPQEKQLLDQDSAFSLPNDVQLRTELAKKNYVFKIESKPKVADKLTFCISAEPKAKEMDVRRYYIDPVTAYPLRLETVSADGDVSVIYTTKSVSYPKKIAANTFEIETKGPFRRMTYSRPTSVDSVGEVKIKLGFTPLIPEGLPFGFKVQEMQINQSPEWKSLVIRMTDGLVRATAYQFRSAGAPAVKTLDPSTVQDVRGIRIMLITDLNKVVTDRLMAAFLSSADDIHPIVMGLRSQPSNLDQRLELNAVSGTLAILDKSPTKARFCRTLSVVDRTSVKNRSF